MRTSKSSPEERRTEILDVAEKLFTTKGYSVTTINDILSEIGIAKGTFYYYFKSKSAVMHAIVDRFVDMEVRAAKKIAANKTLKASEKIFKMMMTQNQDDSRKEKMIEELHKVNNAELHQKSLTETIIHLTPVLTEVIEQGVDEGIFTTPYPTETVEVLLVSSGFIFDEGIFQWSPTEQMQKAEAFVHLTETVLGAEKGSFQYLLQRLSGE